MAKVDTIPARTSAGWEAHDHEWRRSRPRVASSSVYVYRCEDCFVTWSGFMEPIDDSFRVTLRRG